MTEEPYRKMSSNQEFHKTKLKKKKKKTVKRQRQSAASAVKCEI